MLLYRFTIVRFCQSRLDLAVFIANKTGYPLGSELASNLLSMQFLMSYL